VAKKFGIKVELNSINSSQQKGDVMKHDKNEVPLSKKVGDKLERVGQKISNSGAEKIGSFVSRMGDKLEHSSDDKPDADAGTVKKTNK